MTASVVIGRAYCVAVHGTLGISRTECSSSHPHDLGNAVARRHGLVFEIDEETKELFRGSFSNVPAERNGDDSWELPVPATFVVDASVIRFAHVDADYLTERADPEEDVDVLRTLGE